MTLPRIFILVALILLGSIGLLALNKKKTRANSAPVQQERAASTKVFEGQPIEIDLKQLNPQAAVLSPVKTEQVAESAPILSAEPMPPFQEIDNTKFLFQKNSPLSMVQTVRYKSQVAWKPGKAAWLADYASHYQTPVDFIARSLNGRLDYTVPQISQGAEFNVLRTDKNFSFYMVIDLSHCNLSLYVLDPDDETRFLLKNYRVGLGRLDASRKSGSLTPLGTYTLGNRVAVFKPKMMGTHKMKRVELIRVFGTRWIPFEKEVENCTEPAKGFGIHGTPWAYNEAEQALVDNDSSIGGYESDGCIRLRSRDIEELYSIVSTRGATLQIVRDFRLAKLPYKDKLIEQKG